MLSVTFLPTMIDKTDQSSDRCKLDFFNLVHSQTVLDVLIDDQVYRMATTNRQK